MDAFIKYISYTLPSNEISNEMIVEKFPEWDSDKIINKIGVKTRHITSSDEFTSDLASKAIEKLIEENKIAKNSIDFLILCTQSPDYYLPTTACIVQNKVGLSTSCAAIDINQGCSGYIYGLSLAKGLIISKVAKNVVLVTSETYSKHIHPEDKGNMSIFGDGASATLITNNGKYKIGEFTLGTDGSGSNNLIVRNGGIKNKIFKEDISCQDNYLYMNGPEIFNFTIKAVPELIDNVLEKNNENLDSIDNFIFHQANTFMLNFLRKRIKIPEEKFTIDMENYGNTVSSTIPITLKNQINKLKNYNKILLAGFGVGYSWGGVIIYKND